MIDGDKIVFVMIYVDNLLIWKNSRAFDMKLKQYLKEKFDVNDLGEATHCLGI